MARSTMKKISKETQSLNDKMDELDLIDIYRIFHHHLFLKCTQNLLRLDHILGHKSSLGKFKKIEIISNIFSDHNVARLDVNSRKETIKNTNI